MADEPEYVKAARARALKPEQRDPAAMHTEREVIHVAEIPTPPPTPGPADLVAEQARRSPLPSASVEEAIAEIVRRNLEAMGTELRALGLRFDPRMQSDLTDYCFALLSGIAGGGAIPRRI